MSNLCHVVCVYSSNIQEQNGNAMQIDESSAPTMVANKSKVSQPKSAQSFSNDGFCDDGFPDDDDDFNIDEIEVCF